jgi:hypothetical protein
MAALRSESLRSHSGFGCLCSGSVTRRSGLATRMTPRVERLAQALLAEYRERLCQRNVPAVAQGRVRPHRSTAAVFHAANRPRQRHCRRATKHLHGGLPRCSKAKDIHHKRMYRSQQSTARQPTVQQVRKAASAFRRGSRRQVGGQRPHHNGKRVEAREEDAVPVIRLSLV